MHHALVPCDPGFPEYLAVTRSHRLITASVQGPHNSQLCQYAGRGWTLWQRRAVTRDIRNHHVAIGIMNADNL